MSKVSIYVENMFAGLPHTRQAAAQKTETRQRLEARYAALLAEGKNEDEALGIVVAENDDLNDLRAKLGVRRGDAAKETLLAEYEAFTRRFAGGVSIGVVLCLLAVAALIVLSGLMQPGSSLPGALFFVLAAAGIGIFVFYGIKNGHYLERLQAAGCEPEPLTLQRRKRLCDRISSAIMAAAAVVFVSMGVAGLWHPGWVALPIGGVLCAVVWLILDGGRGDSGDNDKK